MKRYGIALAFWIMSIVVFGQFNTIGTANTTATNNTRFIWLGTSGDRLLGIGTPISINPASRLEVAGAPTPTTSDLVTFTVNSGTHFPSLRFRRTGGTQGGQTVALAGYVAGGIYGNILSNGTTGFADIASIQFVTGSTTPSVSNSPGYITFNTNNNGSTGIPSERMRITEAGDIGIGINAPTAKLEVNGLKVRLAGTSAPGAVTYELNNGGGGGIAGAFESIIGSPNRIRIGSKSNNDFTLFANNIDYITIKTDGKVGVGSSITSPTEQLHVGGNVLATGNIVAMGNLTSATGSISAPSISAGSISSGSSFTVGAGIINVNNSSSAMQLQTNSITKMTILTNGFVGVGSSITTPTEQLHVGGNILATGNFTSSGSVTASGVSAVGTISAGSFTATGSLTSASVSSTGNISGGNLITTGGILNVNSSSNAMQLQTNGTTKMTILSNGNVGIGTTLTNNPNNYLLAVKGKIGAHDVQVENSSTTWADYVFEPQYQLPKLMDVERFIKENGHLEGVPTAAEVKENGYSVSSMDEVLLKKVEELTLYVIEQQKEIEALKKKVNKRSKK